MSLFLVTGVHYIEVEANDKEEALIRYRKNGEVKSKKGFNSGEIGCINNFYLSAEDWIEINERECEMEIKEYE